jgi:hypothetical protein
VELPRHNAKTKLAKGSVCFVKRPQSVTILFCTEIGRVITETGVPYFILSTGRDVDAMVYNAWESACGYVTEKHLSRPDKKLAAQMVDTMKELLGV